MKTVVKSLESSHPTRESGKVSRKRKKNKKKSIVVVQPSESTKPPTNQHSLVMGINHDESLRKKRKPKRRKSEKTEKTGSSHIPNSNDLVGKIPPPLSTSSDRTQAGKKKREKCHNSKNSSLREKMLGRLSAARFRFINEELYTWDGKESPVFAKDSKAFSAYHSGFRQQTKLWPINPIDVIIKSIKKLPCYSAKVIADFGCGEAKLAQELSSNKVFSFDLVALNDKVTVADNANVKLYSGSVDVAVHCLSLMSSKISAYVKEANRVLKTGGLLKIAEVESRFEDVDKFVANVCKFNFKLVKKDLSHNLFYFLDFEKLGDIGVARKRKLPILTLQPCLYKKSIHALFDKWMNSIQTRGYPDMTSQAMDTEDRTCDIHSSL